MKQKTTLGAITLALGLLWGCGSSPSLKIEKYEDISPRKSKIYKSQVINDSSLVSFPEGLLYHNGLLIYADQQVAPFIRVFDTTGRELYTFLNKGRAENEAVAISQPAIDYTNNQMVIFDRMQKKLLRYTLPTKPNDSIKFLDIISRRTTGGAVTSVKPRSGRYLTHMFNRNMRYGVFQGDSVKNIYSLFPQVDPDPGINASIWAVKNLCAVSADGKHMVDGTFVGAILEFFEFEGDSVRLKRLLPIYEPIYNTQPNTEWVFQTPETKYGFSSTVATDRYVYAFFSGRKNRPIIVFDWEGNALCEMLIDKPLLSFCVDEKNGNIYGITSSKESDAYVWVKYHFSTDDFM